MKYKTLNQTHPDYDADLLRKRSLLFQGGDAILEQAGLFIHQRPGETNVAYQQRLKCSSYENHFGSIVNSLSAELFSKQMSVAIASDGDDAVVAGGNPRSTRAGEDQAAHDRDEAATDGGAATGASQPDVAGKKGAPKSAPSTAEVLSVDVPPVYKAFEDAADMAGNTLEQIMRERTSQAMAHGVSYLGVDFPKPGELPSTLLEEEQSGADRPYVFPIDVESVTNWAVGDDGRFQWVVLRKEELPQLDYASARDTRVITFKCWRMDGSVAKYEVWEFRCKAGEQPKPNADGELVDSGVTSFPVVPVVPLKMPSGLDVGSLIGNLAAASFRKRNELDAAQGYSLFEVLVYKQGAELPSDGSLAEAGQNPNRGAGAVSTARSRGAMVVGPTDEVDFKGPSGAAFKIADEQIKDLNDQMNKITHTMAQSIAQTTTSNGRSGKSKQQDNKAKEIVLTAYADVVKDYVRNLYGLIAKARKEDLDWRVIGMDSYRQVDIDSTVAEIVALSAGNPIPSKTFKKQQLVRWASTLEELSPQQLLLVQQEVEQAVDATPDMTLTTPETEADKAKGDAEHGTQQAIAVEKAKAQLKPKAPAKRASAKR